MKRSEMINMIFVRIPHMSIPDIMGMLDIVESAGMLPPDAMPPALSLGERETKDAIWARTRFRWETENEQ